MRKLVALLVLLCLASAPCLAKPKGVVGCGTKVKAAAQPQLRLSLNHADRRYETGDQLVLTIVADRSCYLTILDIGTSGKVSVLLPNEYSGDNRLQAGEARRFPAPGRDGFQFTVTPPPGEERLVVIATTRPRQITPADLKRYPSTNGRFTGSVIKGSGLQWACAVAKFWIR